MSTPQIYWGTGNLSSFRGSSSSTDTESAVVEALKLLQSHSISHIDTAQRYGNGKAEEIVGKALASARPDANDTTGLQFTIDTKWAVPLDRAMTDDETLASAQQSQTLLTDNNTNTTILPIDTFYLHSFPTDDTDFKKLLSTINSLHASGLFNHFGLSNCTASQITQVHELCQSHNWVLPTVYQGEYNAVHRHSETELFPVLRKLNVSFRAYSPVAGGFLTKTRAVLESPETSGRFSSALAGTPAGRYRDTYITPKMLDALDTWGDIAAGEGIGAAELAYRWVVYHAGLDGTKGDGVIVGAGSVGQLEETVGWIERGPLTERTVERVETVWGMVSSGAVSKE